MTRRPKILSVVGARPNFMKVAPLHRALEAHGGFQSRIVHTGQHYDDRMSDIFFRQLELPEPHVYLGVGSGSHADQTARIMIGFEQVLMDEAPDLVIVVGDVNSTVACSLVAVKQHVPVAHVEAGLRSFDRRMPEEINRVVTDRISDWLFVTEQSGLDNLSAEGVDGSQVFFVGNLMIDSLVRFRDKAAESSVSRDLDLESGTYVLTTLHRPSNVDEQDTLCTLVDLLEGIAGHSPVVFPVHPRTRRRLQESGLVDRFDAIAGIHALEPLGYLDFLHLLEHAGVVLTDSGGIQEETTFLGVPCLTLRENTERPSTIEAGTNELVTLDPGRIGQRVQELMAEDKRAGAVPPLWDGATAGRIVEELERLLLQ